MDPIIKERLSKIYNLVNQGATDGERAAAKLAMDKIVAKHNITPEQLTELHRMRRYIAFNTNLELGLLAYILRYFNADMQSLFRTRQRKGSKIVNILVAELSYEAYINVECAFEYFRRHMNKEWRRVCLPELKKKRKSGTRAKLKKTLEDLFIEKYIIASGLIEEKHLHVVKFDANSAEGKRRMMLKQVEGGKYNRQLNTNLLLEN